LALGESTNVIDIAQLLISQGINIVSKMPEELGDHLHSLPHSSSMA
jgi:hypothetical protein